jgi:hypothetical protein
MAQAGQHLPSKRETQSSNPITATTKKKKKKKDIYF